MTNLHLKIHPIIEDIYDIVSQIMPFDLTEDHHIQDVLEWINSGASFFRTKKPNVPSTHLCSYFVLFDEAASKVLLVDHKNAQLWLPAGGHVDVDEDPRMTVKRECLEDLNMEADFWRDQPIFISSTMTVALTPAHTDINLWYVLKGNHQTPYLFDTDTFNGLQWFDLEDIPYGRTDPHMARFIRKLKTLKALKAVVST